MAVGDLVLTCYMGYNSINIYSRDNEERVGEFSETGDIPDALWESEVSMWSITRARTTPHFKALTLLNIWCDTTDYSQSK